MVGNLKKMFKMETKIEIKPRRYRRQVQLLRENKANNNLKLQEALGMVSLGDILLQRLVRVLEHKEEINKL